MIENILEATKNRSPILLEKIGSLERGFSIGKLLTSINKLIEENLEFSAQGKGYLEQIETTLGKLREAVIIIDFYEEIRLSNDAFQLLVQTTSDPKDHRIDRYIQGTSMIELLRTIRSGVIPHRSEMEVVINDEKKWLEISAAFVNPESDPKSAMTLLVFHDISHQKQLEEMRKDFVANVSHELKTPVTIISGYADTLIEDIDELEEAQRNRFLGKIKDNSDRLDRLIQDLLLISRLESTDVKLEKEKVSFSNFVKTKGDDFKHRLDEMNKKIEYQFDHGNDEIWIDTLRISQVINNLIENIISHAKGFTTITIQTQISSKGIQCSIGDDGSGIPEKDIEHIFERFYRVEKGRGREKGGTGLGMSIVKHIIKSHKGMIKAESYEGKGTKISFHLPHLKEEY